MHGHFKCGDNLKEVWGVFFPRKVYNINSCIPVTFDTFFFLAGLA